MKHRDPKKDGDLFSMIEHQQSALKTVKDLYNMDRYVFICR